jgi:hypothetical protein
VHDQGVGSGLGTRSGRVDDDRPLVSPAATELDKEWDVHGLTHGIDYRRRPGNIAQQGRSRPLLTDCGHATTHIDVDTEKTLVLYPARCSGHDLGLAAHDLADQGSKFIAVETEDRGDAGILLEHS